MRGIAEERKNKKIDSDKETEKRDVQRKVEKRMKKEVRKIEIMLNNWKK